MGIKLTVEHLESRILLISQAVAAAPTPVSEFTGVAEILTASGDTLCTGALLGHVSPTRR